MKFSIGGLLVIAGCSGSTGPAGATGATGAQGSQGTMGDQGAMGAAGQAGKDGTLRIYGDGSAGAHTVSANEDWLSSPPDNLQFTDFTIDAGAYLGVPSGTIIRVTGTFTNNGVIAVLEGVPGGDQLGPAPDSGVAMSAAGAAEFGTSATYVRGGNGGRGITTQVAARMLVRVGIKGGGGGGAAQTSRGADGGGTFTVLALGAINNSATGSIDANGYPGDMGGGGGGGGIVILASTTSVTNSGVINAKGGTGGLNPALQAGAGGGGGGGIVHLLAPVVVAGTEHVEGGTGGVGGTVSQSPRSGGGGGGGCGGMGGGGGGVATNNTASAGQDGGSGYALTTIGDPSALF